MAVEMETFDVDAVEADDEVTVTFTLNGEKWSCRNRDQIGAYVIDSAFRGQTTDLQFIQSVLIPADAKRFMEKLPREDFPFGVKQRLRLTEFLVEKLVNHPTVPLDSSGPGRRNAKATSAESSSSRATRRQRSAS